MDYETARLPTAVIMIKMPNYCFILPVIDLGIFETTLASTRIILDTDLVFSISLFSS